MPSFSNQKRDRLGRYAELHPCYVCGKSAGENYFSDRRTDTLTPTGEDFGDMIGALLSYGGSAPSCPGCGEDQPADQSDADKLCDSCSEEARGVKWEEEYHVG
jgi:hypothetical protein